MNVEWRKCKPSVNSKNINIELKETNQLILLHENICILYIIYSNIFILF